MWVLLIIYALMGSLLSMYLKTEMNWDIGDCLFAGVFWPIVLIWAYIEHINNNG